MNPGREMNVVLTDFRNKAMNNKVISVGGERKWPCGQKQSDFKHIVGCELDLDYRKQRCRAQSR